MSTVNLKNHPNLTMDRVRVGLIQHFESRFGGVPDSIDKLLHAVYIWNENSFKISYQPHFYCEFEKSPEFDSG